MPVMESIRKATDSTAMKLIFGAIVLVFVFWGIGQTNGPTAQVIAEVNGQRITDTEYQRVMRDLARRQGGNMDEDDLNALGRQVISDLIEKKILLQEAEKLGLEVSDEEIARYVLQVDAFKDNAGKFDKELYTGQLKRMGLTESRFEDQIRTQLLLDKLNSIADSSVHVTDAEARRLYDEQASRLEVSWVTIPNELLLPRVPVDETQLTAYLDANADEVRKQYDTDLDRLYSTPAKADVSMILLRSDLDEGKVSEEDLQARADAIVAQARGAADFAELARRWSEDLSAVTGGRRGMLSRPQMDATVADAVFTAGAGKIADPVKTARGLQILQVHEVVDPVVTPFEDVKRDIARDMLARQDVDKVGAEVATQVLDAWKGADAPPQTLLDEYGLQVQDSGPISPGRLGLLGATGGPDLQQALAKATEAGVLDKVFAIEGGRLVAKVDSYSPADPGVFEAQRDNIKSSIASAKQSLFMQMWTRSLRDSAKVVQYYSP